MDATALLVGFVSGGAAGWLVAGLLAKRERDGLRAESSDARSGEAAAKASLAAAQQAADEQRAATARERERADKEGAARSLAEQRVAALEVELEQRKQNLAEQRSLLERAQETLKDVFKATGADVLRSTAESLLRQAKEQFDGQRTLGQQELEARQKAIDATVTPLREQLAKQEELVKQLGEKREGDAKSLAEQIRQIAELQQKASTAAQSLSSALRDTRQRGRWGEVSLRNVAELAGLAANVDFTEQSTVEGGEGALLRPDMIVHLPGARRVPVDSKVPMDAYLDSIRPDLSDDERASRRAAHAQALRNHVRALASREYAKALGAGVEITVLHVPLESGLIAALEEDPAIYPEALDRGVIITTASTLLALLRTCALQWQQAKLNENARRIGEAAKQTLERLVKFVEHFEKVGVGLTAAAKSYDAAVGSFNSRLLPSARETAELAGDPNLAPEELPPSAAPLRELNAPTRALPEE